MNSFQKFSNELKTTNQYKSGFLQRRSEKNHRIHIVFEFSINSFDPTCENSEDFIKGVESPPCPSFSNIIIVIIVIIDVVLVGDNSIADDYFLGRWFGVKFRRSIDDVGWHFEIMFVHVG